MLKKVFYLLFIISSITFSKPINELSDSEIALLQEAILEENNIDPIKEDETPQLEKPNAVNAVKEEEKEVVTGKSIFFNNSNEIKIEIKDHKNDFKRTIEKTKNSETKNTENNNTTKESNQEREIKTDKIKE